MYGARMFAAHENEGMKEQNKNIWAQIRNFDFMGECLIQMVVNRLAFLRVLKMQESDSEIEPDVVPMNA